MAKEASPLPHENFSKFQRAVLQALERIAYANERAAEAIECACEVGAASPPQKNKGDDA